MRIALWRQEYKRAQISAALRECAGWNSSSSTIAMCNSEVAVVVHAGARRVGRQNGCIPGQRVELVLPAVQRRAEAEAVFQFQGLRGIRPIHNVKVAHFISVDGPAKQEVKQFTRQNRETLKFSAPVTNIIVWRLHG